MQFKISDIVLCPRLGPGFYEIIAEETNEYQVKSADGKVSNIYKVHCHRPKPADTIAHRKKVAEARAERAAKIGRKDK